MGYEITFKIKEYDEKFKGFSKEPLTDEELLIHKAAFEGYCMYPGDSNDSIRMHTIAKSLMFNLRLYTNYLVDSWKASKQKEFESLEPDENGYRELYFCGWSYKDEQRRETIDDLIDLTYSQLYFIVITPTPDRFNHEESNRYQEKLNEIKDIIDEIECSIYEILNHEFLDFYRAKEDTIIEESY